MIPRPWRHRGLLLLLSAGWLLFCVFLAELRAVMPTLRAAGAGSTGPLQLLVMIMPVAMLWAAHLILKPRARLGNDIVPAGWVGVPISVARRHRLYGVRGVLGSLVMGLLLTAAVRVATFVLLLPPVSGPSPDWYLVLFRLMLIETIVIGALYAICVASALHHRGDFPALLMVAWLADLTAGFVVPIAAAATAGFPGTVVHLLENFADGNSWRVLLSAVIWVPYLFASRRANVTFRGYVRADDPLIINEKAAGEI